MKRIFYSLLLSLFFVSITFAVNPNKLDAESTSLLQTVDLGTFFGRMTFKDPYIVFQKCSKQTNAIEEEIRCAIEKFVSIENNAKEAVRILGMASNHHHPHALLSVKNRKNMITFILLKITNRDIEMVESKELLRGKYQMKLASINGRFFMKVK